MRHPRSAMPLPRYTERRWRGGKWTFLFNLPSWAKKVADDDDRGPCPVKSEALGTDYNVAVERAETILLPQFDAWRTRGLCDVAVRVPARGTFDWMVEVYRRSPQYRELDKRVRGNFEYGLGLASNHAIKNDPYGRCRFGQLSLSEITPGLADNLYAKMKVDREPVLDSNGAAVVGDDGTPLVRKTPRLRRAQEVMKACRRAWNVAYRSEPGVVPHINPFQNAEVEAPKSGRTVPATWDQTLAFVKACDQTGSWSIGTAALVSFCWFQRQEHIMGVSREDGRPTGLLWADYRPKNDPNSVVIQHPKTNETVQLPLYSKDGRAHFPELMERLDNAPRRGALVCMRDQPDATGVYRPWPTKGNAPLAVFIRRVAAIRDQAGLPKEITFRSFRHGGFTAGGEADLSDADLNALGAKTDATLDLYRKGTMEQRRRALTRLLDQRSNQQRLSTLKPEICPPGLHNNAINR
jgi:hypothetical protein